MWAPWVAHYFHLRREHMLEVSLHDFLDMVDFVKG